MKKEKVANLLIDLDAVKVQKYIDYVEKLITETKDGKLKNQWANSLKDEQIAEFFKIVTKEGLEFDGKHIYIANSYGKISIGYDYQAYKNKMYIVYPESIIDVGLVRESDTYNSWKESGKVCYKHITGNPFGNETVKGVYCIIKNRRGEFITELSGADIEKHRKKAKSDNVWNEWFEKMCLKTGIKSAVSMHYQDVFGEMIAIDNEESDLDKTLDISVDMKREIENLSTKEELSAYYEKHVGKASEMKYDPYEKAAIIKTLASRKQEILEGF